MDYLEYKKVQDKYQRCQWQIDSINITIDSLKNQMVVEEEKLEAFKMQFALLEKENANAYCKYIDGTRGIK